MVSCLKISKKTGYTGYNPDFIEFLTGYRTGYKLVTSFFFASFFHYPIEPLRVYKILYYTS
ncbi:hypothetical protein MTMBA_10390 [Moorella thermoacetica]